MATFAHPGTDDSRTGIEPGSSQAELADLVRGLCGLADAAAFLEALPGKLSRARQGGLA